jgi:hypothetical protein
MRMLIVVLLAGLGMACEKHIREARTTASGSATHTSGATRSTAASVGFRYSCPK